MTLVNSILGLNRELWEFARDDGLKRLGSDNQSPQLLDRFLESVLVARLESCSQRLLQFLEQEPNRPGRELKVLALLLFLYAYALRVSRINWFQVSRDAAVVAFCCCFSTPTTLPVEV